jgi:hypothetical protein
MPIISVRHKVRFDEGKLAFSETFPQGLEGTLPLAEFDSVVRKINEELTAEIRATQKNVREWAIVTMSLCIVVIGLFLTPVLFVKTSRQKRQLKEFWERLRAYLGEVNRKTFLKRNLEWRLVEDTKKRGVRDVVNPEFAYRIEIVHRIQKSKKATEGKPGLAAVAAGNGKLSSTPSDTATSESPRHVDQQLADEDGSDQGSVLEEEEEDENLSQGEEDDFIIEEVDEDDFEEEDVGNLASISSQGAGSYSRGSLITTPAALAVAASMERARTPSETTPPNLFNSESESAIDSEPTERRKRSSRVRFTGLFEDEEESIRGADGEASSNKNE